MISFFGGLMVFGGVIILVVLSFLGAVELSERSYEFKKIMERNHSVGEAIPKSMIMRKRKLDASKLLLWMVCAGMMLLYASYG
jgi:hypothetical protein